MFNKISNNRGSHITTFQIIILSFFCLVLMGTILLMLPISSRANCVTPLRDAMFTAVSATCVTGLVVRDTATYWSPFGQVVILALIQIGGMGVITVGLTIIRVSGRKIGLWQRSAMQESISAPQVGGIVKLTSFILKISIIIELIGAALLFPVFFRDFGLVKGIWYSIFHSISAFCNAGFDLMGSRGKFSSLTSYSSQYYLNIIIMLLIICGGIGFLVWSDIGTYKGKFDRYTLQSKMALLVSAVLIILPALYLFFYEYNGISIHDRVINSLFQSVTTRTAGFNTTDLAAMDESSTAIMVILMLIGGSPGSTAGGMKTVTFAVLLLSAITVFSRRNDIQFLKRRIPEDAVRSAGAVLFMYIFLFLLSAIIISRIEGYPLLTCLFETSSAIGTVGLTLGITNKLSLVSHIILMILMFFGRVGGLTLIYAALPSADNKNSRYPLEKISIG
ncbi:MAG: Trk family potassium uptake protein [Eubacterium sp.]|nr:Trk family potassium uptake protein [Eubacterium sp.]